jgi:hypothetical protein
MREAGLKAMTVWLPKEGADRLARYPEKERGEVITRALVLLESQGIPEGKHEVLRDSTKLTGNDTTLIGVLTGESRGEDEGEDEEGTLTLARLFTRLKRVEAILSTITSNSTGKLIGEATVLTGESTRELTGEAPSITGESTDKSAGEGAVALSETPLPPVAEPPAKLPLKRVAALTRRAKKLHAQGVSWREIAHRFNAEDVPTLSGIGQWHGSTVQHMIEKHGRE